MIAPGDTLGQVIVIELYRQVVVAAKSHGHGKGIFIVITVNGHLESVAGTVQFQLQQQAVFFPVF